MLLDFLFCALFIFRHKDEMLKLDFLSDYSSYGPHGKPYVNWCDQEPSDTHH